MQSGRTRKVFRVHKDFKPDSYTVSQPPPLCSFEKGIPLCAFGYKRSRDWLREYTLKHQLVADIIPEIQSQYDLAQVAAQYIYKQIGQERYLSTKEGDGPYEYVFLIGFNRDEESLKKAFDPQNLHRLRKALDIADDDSEPARWIRLSA